jgi:hypothetical protein
VPRAVSRPIPDMYTAAGVLQAHRPTALEALTERIGRSRSQPRCSCGDTRSPTVAPVRNAVTCQQLKAETTGGAYACRLPEAPPYPSQKQPMPGSTAEMDPRPDHGETSYKA